jgi:alpha-mannosidase
MAPDLLEQILPFIKNAIYPQRLTLTDWRIKEGEHPESAAPAFNDKSWTAIQIPFQWEKHDKTFWVRRTLTIPEAFAGKPTALLLNFQDALLYVNGKPYYGIDKHHNEIFLSEKPKTGEKFVVALDAYSGKRQDRSLFESAELAVMDATARRLYNGLTILHELETFVDGTQEQKDIHELIRRTLVYLKYFRPGGEEYPNAIKRAYNFLLNTLEVEFKTTIAGIVHLIGHAHIDVAWLWTLKDTARKCGKTFATTLRLMEEFPEFRFAQSQPYLYELTKQQYPEIYKYIKQRVAERRWEPIGAMWVEADCNLPNGESLVRQILFGKKFFKEEFGINSNVLWLPDSFGFAWSLPQILKKSGIDYFYTSKLLWNDTNEFPYTSFWWQGLDGTKILAHHSPVGLEGTVSPLHIQKNASSNPKETIAPSNLQTYGCKHGGSGITKEQLEYAAVLKTITGLPTSKLSTVQEFFQQIEQQSAEFPIWNNELYLETHRGTYTTHAKIKKDNRECETLLHNAELLSTLGMLYGNNSAVRKYPQQELETAWKRLLLNQFHDILPGTSISSVYEDAANDHDAIRKTTNALMVNALSGISKPVKKSSKEFSFVVFNPLGWARSEYAEITVPSLAKHFAIIDETGKAVECQLVEHSEKEQSLLCYIENIPAFGAKNLTVKPAETAMPSNTTWNVSLHGAETPFYKIRFDNKGTISSLYARQLKRDLIEKGKHGNIFQTFRDVPHEWEAWNIDSEAEKSKLDLWHFKQIRIVEEGPLRATLRLDFKTDGGSTLTQHIHFYHKSPRIDFQTHVKWKEKQTLFKVAFPLNVKARSAAYEIPFGVIQRPTKSSDTLEHAKFEVPAQQWADISESKCGVSLLNDSKYGYDVKENVLRLTLLRSPHAPNPNDPSKADTATIDLGEHSFAYALYPHSGTWANGLTQQHATEFNNRLVSIPNAVIEPLPSLVASSKPNVLISSIKKAEDGQEIVVRLYESQGTATDTVLQFGVDTKKAAECDLLENSIKEYNVKKSKLSLRFKPFEIKTIKIAVKPKSRKP